MARQIVDEHRDRGLILLDQAAHRLALAAAAADHRRVEVMERELLDPPLLMPGADVGEDDDIGLGAERRHSRECAGDRILQPHLLPTDAVEPRPYLSCFQRRAARLSLTP